MLLLLLVLVLRRVLRGGRQGATSGVLLQFGRAVPGVAMLEVVGVGRTLLQLGAGVPTALGVHCCRRDGGGCVERGGLATVHFVAWMLMRVVGVVRVVVLGLYLVRESWVDGERRVDGSRHLLLL